jgi:DNA mismatch endonuclease (patch repair protein)
VPKELPLAADELTSIRMRATPQYGTRPELALRTLLRRRGLRFRVHSPLPVGRRRADVAFPRLRLAVFLDGCFWHGCPQHMSWPKNNAEWWREKIAATQARDRETDELLAEAGWQVVRVWEHEPVQQAADEIVRLAATASR